MIFFPKKRVYLDWAAAAPVLPVAQAAYDAAAISFGNPSSPHTEGRASRDILESARTALAHELEVKADDIIFTSGATEANNIAIQGYVQSLLARGRTPNSIHLLYLPSSHASIVETIHALAQKGVTIESLPIKDGKVDVAALKELIRPEIALVSMDYVCGETGTIWNVREVRQTLPKGVRLHVDASQAPLVESVERNRLAADLLTLDAQKIGGVRGIGLLIASRTLGITPIMYGGGQEQGIRPGTPMPAHAAAFAAALVAAGVARDSFIAHATTIKKILVAATASIPSISINAGAHAVPHILNVSLSGRDTDYVLALLDESGFAVSTKSACESDSEEGSRAVLALTNDVERAKATLRISWGPSTTPRDIRRFSKALVKAVTFIDATKL